MTEPTAMLIPEGNVTLVYEVPSAEAPALEFWLKAFGFTVETRTDDGDTCRITARPCACGLCADGRKARLREALQSLAGAKPRTVRSPKRGRQLTPEDGARFFNRLRNQISK